MDLNKTGNIVSVEISEGSGRIYFPCDFVGAFIFFTFGLVSVCFDVFGGSIHLKQSIIVMSDKLLFCKNCILKPYIS